MFRVGGQYIDAPLASRPRIPPSWSHRLAPPPNLAPLPPAPERHRLVPHDGLVVALCIRDRALRVAAVAQGGHL